MMCSMVFPFAGRASRSGGRISSNNSFFTHADGSKTVVDMSSDGNCLFRSLSDQLYLDYGINHDEVRSEICDYLEAHEDEFSIFLVLDEEDEDAADFDSYVQSMREDGEWGGNLELVAAARLYR